MSVSVSVGSLCHTLTHCTAQGHCVCGQESVLVVHKVLLVTSHSSWAPKIWLAVLHDAVNVGVT